MDSILPNSGFQRGRLAVWAPGVGAAAFLHAACRHTARGGDRAVWIDTPHLVTGACWRAGPLLIRPKGPLEALRTAEILTRSGGFALLVLDGTEPAGPELVRLARAAHEGGAALVLLTRATTPASLRLASRTLLGEYGWRRSCSGETDDIQTVRVRVEARASGWRAGTEFTIPVWHDDLRLSLASGRPDRRGGRR